MAVAPAGVSHGYAHVAPSALCGLGSRRTGMEAIPRGAERRPLPRGACSQVVAPSLPRRTGACDVTTRSEGHVPLSLAVARGAVPLTPSSGFASVPETRAGPGNECHVFGSSRVL